MIVKTVTKDDIQEKKYYYYMYLVIDLNSHTDAGFYIGSRKGNSYGKGYKMTEEQRKRCSEARQGFKAYQAIAVDIYEYTSDNLIASRVCLNEWCKMTGVNQGNLTKTKRKEDGSSVRRHHNNMYIKESYGR